MMKTRMSKLSKTINHLLRKVDLYNEYENEMLTEEFENAVIALKEKNSQIVFESYYLPKAISAILKEEGYLVTAQMAEPRATAMMLSDMAEGILTEFYKFKE